jgi:hypothetical protein
MVTRQTHDAEQALYRQMLAVARQRNWTSLKETLVQFGGRVAMHVGEPQVDGKQDLTRREQRVWETVLVLAAAEVGLLLTREEYGDQLIVTALATPDGCDPFLNA